MKNFKKAILLLIISLSGLFFSCKIVDPTDGLQVRVTNIARQTTVAVEVRDLQSGKRIGAAAAEKITVTFDGANKNDVITLSNLPITEITATDGILNFAINDDITPTTVKPVELILNIQSGNYSPVSKKITITGTTANSFLVDMLKIKNETALPTGVATGSSSGSATVSTGLTQPLVTSAQTSTSNSGTVTIPAQTVFKDKNGAALSGNVTSSLYFFDPHSVNITNIFPGAATGFNITMDQTIGSGSSIKSSTFYPVSFVELTLAVNGTSVYSFNSDSLVVNMKIPNTTINPVTGSTYKAGDVIGMYLYKPQTGIWKKISDYSVPSGLSSGGRDIRSVLKKANVILSASKTNTQGSLAKILDETQGGVFIVLGTPGCNLDKGEGYVINKLSFGSSACFGNQVDVFIKNIDSTIIAGTVGVIGTDNVITLAVPVKTCSDKVNVKITKPSNPSFVFVDQVVPLQTNVTEYPVTATNQSGGVNVHVTITGKCKDGKTLSSANKLPIWIYKDDQWQYVGEIVEGQVTINCIQLGVSYKYRTKWEDKYVPSDTATPETHTATSTNEAVEFTIDDPSLCN
jgi:hypothetical protein